MTEENLALLLQNACRQIEQLPPWRLHQMDMAGRCEASAACWASNEGVVTAGECDQSMTLMSTIKPFLLLHLFDTQGVQAVDSWVDDIPSSKPYWSLRQLQEDHGRPRNAMINSGAMLLASRLHGGSPSEQVAGFLGWLENFCPKARLAMDETCLAEVLEPGGDPHNLALAHELQHAGGVEDAMSAFETYFRLCCLSGTMIDVARLGHAINLACQAHRDRVLRTMQTCGLYESSSEWFSRTGLAAKSAVSGIIFGVWPGTGCLAACGEWLDDSGNPLVPQLLLQGAATMMPPRALQP